MENVKRIDNFRPFSTNEHENRNAASSKVFELDKTIANKNTKELRKQAKITTHLKLLQPIQMEFNLLI